MKNPFYLCFLFICLLLNCTLSGQSWQQLADFPGDERDDAISFTLGSKVYCGTGVTWTGALRDMYIFDLTTETWSNSDSIPAGSERQYASAFSYNGKGYVFGGLNDAGTYLNDLLSYDTLTKLWQYKSALPSAGRSGSSSFIINDTAYILSGKNSVTNASNEVWAYNLLNDTWSQKNNLPFGGRWKGSAAALNGKAYFIFGRNENGKFCNELFEYDPVSDSWAKIDTFPGIGRNYASMQALDNKLFITMGIDTFKNCYNDLWKYDNSQWVQMTSLPSFGRKGGTSFTGNNTLYYTTGNKITSPILLKETWKIDNVTGLEEKEKEIFVQIFPNPAREEITIMFPQTMHILSEISLVIYNVMGEIVGKRQLAVDEHEIKMDVSTLTRGIYFLEVRSDRFLVMKKFIKN